jgi:hypothetical protein
MEAVGRVNPAASAPSQGGRSLSIAIVALLLLVPIVIVGIVLLAVITRSATRRDPNDEENETSEQDPGKHSGPGRD